MLRSIEIKPWFLRFVLYEHFSSSLSCPRNLWVTEVEEPQNRPRVYWGTEVSCANYPGERKCTARKLSWGTEVHCAKYPGERKCTARNYPGERKCSTEIILGNGSAVREIILGNGSAVPKLSWGTEDDCDRNILGNGRRPRLASAALVAPSPARRWRAALFRAPV